MSIDFDMFVRFVIIMTRFIVTRLPQNTPCAGRIKFMFTAHVGRAMKSETRLSQAAVETMPHVAPETEAAVRICVFVCV